MKKSTTTASRKLKNVDKKKAIDTFSELAESIIQLADRQDKYDDNVTRLNNAQERLQASLDNLLSATKDSQKISAEAIKIADAAGKAIADMSDKNSKRVIVINDIQDHLHKLDIKNEGIDTYTENIQKKCIYNSNNIDGILDKIISFNAKPWYKIIFSKI